MGYRIEYQPVIKTYRQERKKTAALILGCIAMLCCTTAVLFYEEGITQLQSWFIPGDDAVTTAAMGEMLTSLQKGTPILTAFKTFCHAIWDGAQLALH